MMMHNNMNKYTTSRINASKSILQTALARIWVKLTLVQRKVNFSKRLCVRGEEEGIEMDVSAL